MVHMKVQNAHSLLAYDSDSWPEIALPQQQLLSIDLHPPKQHCEHSIHPEKPRM